MSIVNLDKLMQSSKRAELFDTLFADEGKVLSFGDLLDTLNSNPGTVIYADTFRTLTVQDILNHAASLVVVAPGKAPRATVDVPAIENFKDEAVQAAWKASVVRVLTGAEGRGISPQKIRVTIGSGNEAQGRELMTQMETAGVIYATSKARGKKYVLAAAKAQADAAWAAEQAAAKAEDDAKAAKAAATPAAEAKPTKATKPAAK